MCQECIFKLYTIAFDDISLGEAMIRSTFPMHFYQTRYIHFRAAFHLVWCYGKFRYRLLLFWDGDMLGKRYFWPFRKHKNVSPFGDWRKGCRT